MAQDFELNVLDIVSRYAPRQWRVNPHNRRNHYSMSCPLPGHRGDAEHPDHSGSFSVDQTGSLFKCFGCGGQGNARQLQRLLVDSDPFPTTPSPGSYRSQPRTPAPPRRRKESLPPQGVTLAQLAQAKNLDLHFLQDFMGWRDTTWFGAPAIEIPYPDENNGNFLIRYRVGLDAEDRFRWKRFEEGQQARPYGLWALDFCRQKGYCIIVEGETDTATLLYHQFPAVGLPGGGQWRDEWRHYFKGISRLYVWREPASAKEKQQQQKGAGQFLVESLAKSFPQLQVVAAPPEAKDPNELAAHTGDGFKATMQSLLDGAQPYWAPPPGNLSPKNWTQLENQERCCLIVSKYDNKLAARYRGLVRNGYRAEGKLEEARRVATCYCYLRPRLWESGDMEGVRFHCFLRGCPNCTYLRLGQFIEEKQEAFDNLVDPAVYRIRLGRKQVGQTRQEMASNFDALYKEMRQMNKSYTEHYGKFSELAKNHVYSLRTAVRCGWAEAEIDLLGNYEARSQQDIAEHFSKETGCPVQVEVLHWGYLNDQEKRRRRALDIFRRMVALQPFDWTLPEEFGAWLWAMRRVKLVQGKGVFHKASGGLKPSGPKSAEAEVGGGVNPFTGRTEGWYYLSKLSPEEAWDPFQSVHTGRWHFRAREGVDVLAYDSVPDEESDAPEL